MSLECLIEKICVQTAVYWGTPTQDGYGGLTFADPVEILVRWEDTTKIIFAANGEEYACIAEISVKIDLDINGYLYLGELSDIDAADQPYPKTIEGAYRIRRVDKTPVIKKTDEFVREVYL